MFDSIITAAGFIWFMVGTVIFFVVAGTIAGLSFRQQAEERYDLTPVANQRRTDEADDWPVLPEWEEPRGLPPTDQRLLPDYGAPPLDAETGIVPLPQDPEDKDDDFDDWPLSLP